MTRRTLLAAVASLLVWSRQDEPVQVQLIDKSGAVLGLVRGYMVYLDGEQVRFSFKRAHVPEGPVRLFLPTLL